MGTVYLRAAICVVLVCASVCVGCSEPAAGLRTARKSEGPASGERLAGASEASIAVPPQTVSTGLAGADAFDLVATLEGAVLAWAERGGCRRAIRTASLDATGRVRARAEGPSMAGCPRAEVVDPDGASVTELAAASASGSVGLAWIAEDGHAQEVFGAHGDDGGRHWAASLRLGETVTATSRRGRLSMTAADTGFLRVSFRAPPAPCVAFGTGVCAHYVARAVSPTPASGRGFEQREIPEPCDRMLAGAVWVDGVWYDGVCSRQPEAVTHVFAIRPDISYAEAVPSLSGCEPLGIAPGRGGAVLWGDCSGAYAARLLSPGGSGDLDLRAVHRSVECRDGRPVLRVMDGAGSGFELVLGAQLSRLEGYLAPPLAPPGSRAVWTGEALVIAWPDSDALRLAGHRCHEGVLVRTRS